MRLRIFQLSFWMLFFGTLLNAQPTPVVQSSPKVRSHVERFSTPQMRAEKAELEATAKIEANPNQAESYNARALARMRLNKFAESLEDLQKAIKLKPEESDFHANLGYVLWRLGRFDEAIEAERQALKINPKNFTANYQLGRFLLRKNDEKSLNESAKLLRQALEIDPRQYEVRFELIGVYRALSDVANATAQLDLLQDARPSDARVDYVRALLATDRNDYNLAIADFKETLKKDPTLVSAWQDFGLLYLKLKRWEESAEAFLELQKLRPDSVEASYFRALSLYNGGKQTDAEKEVRKTLRLNAGVVEANILLGIILASRPNSANEALEVLSQSVSLAPDSFDANFYLGRVQYSLKDYLGSVKSFRNALQINPKHSEARFFLGTVLEVSGDSQEALNEYQELVKIDPNSVYGQIGLGAILVKQGKLDEAIAALQKATASDSQNFEAFWALGRAFALKENFVEAVTAFKKAVELAPDRAETHYQLGLALRRIGKTQEAAKEFEIVNRLNKEFRTGANSKPM